MKFGVLLPNRGRPSGDVNLLLDVALLAEELGWAAGIPEPVIYSSPVLIGNNDTLGNINLGACGEHRRLQGLL